MIDSIKMILSIFLGIIIFAAPLYSQEVKFESYVAADSAYFLQYPSLYFGTLCPGQTIDLTFSIENISTQPFQIIECQTFAPFSIVNFTTPMNLNPREVVQFRIRFGVSGKGNFSAPFILRLANRPSADTLTLRGDGRDNSIAISESLLDFGDLPVNRSGDRSFNITNTGSDTIKIGAVTILPTGSPYIVLSPSFPQVLAMGASITVRVRYQPATTGVTTPHASINIDQPCSDLKRVEMRGNGIRGSLSFSRSSIIYADTWCVTDTRIDSMQVRNTGTDTLSVFTATISGTNASDFRIISAPPLPYLLQPNEQISFTIEMKPQGKGNRVAILTIFSADVNNPVKNIPLGGTVRTAVYSATPSVDFGDVRIGTLQDKVIQVQNANPIPVRLASVRFDPPDPSVTLLTALPLPIASSNSTTITIRYTPGTTNTYTGILHLYFDSPCPDSITVNLTGRGIQGEAKFLWAGIAPTLKCNSSSQEFGLENIGTASFDVTAFFLEGRDASSFRVINTPALPVTLRPTESTKTTIQFTPTLRPNGTKIATLGIVLANAPIDTLRVNISAERISPVVTGTGVDFGNTDLRYAAIRNISVQNSETTPATLSFLDIQPAEFRYLGQTTFLLQPPSSSASLPIEFHPLIEGQYTGSIRFISQPCGDTITVPITGAGLRCAAVMNFHLRDRSGSDTLRGAMGQKGSIEITSMDLPGTDNISLLTFRFEYNPTILIPTNVTPGDVTRSDTVRYRILTPGVLEITIVSAATLQHRAGSYAVIEFISVLGDALETSMTLTRLASSQKCFTTYSTRNAHFLLMTGCEERRGEPLQRTKRNQLRQNFPNPFGEATQSGSLQTRIEYRIVQDAFVDLSVFNMLGEKVRTLVHEAQKANRYELPFHASALPAGIYFCVLSVGKEKLVRSMYLMR